ncbi:MAG TPA: family 43 glycosylhydrolase [Bacteroidales bacterium]|nr:family 43 glycosylhydrolase [Bacteroidales bacterium]
MHKFIESIVVFIVPGLIVANLCHAQDFNPASQPDYKVQYFKPAGDSAFAGDPMPFYHDGTFHVFWLTDHNHAGRDHEWAHISSTDLEHWTHYPIALPVDRPYEETMCTGSVIFHGGLYYAFYATRTAENGRTEYISYAISKDGIHFEKQDPNRLITPAEEYETAHFRDPHVFYDKVSETFVMLITTALKQADLERNRYCLLSYTSTDLKNWKQKGPFYFTGNDDGFAYPECPDLFKWHGYYYLLFKVNGGTYYRMSKNLWGPYLTPLEDNIGNDYALVFKTAAFKNDRRIAVGMVPWKAGNKDDGQWQYAGNLVFRELIQRPDGTLKTEFVPEMQPEIKEVKLKNLQTDYRLNALDHFKYVTIEGVPADAHIKCRVVPEGLNSSTGMLLRYSDTGYYELKIDAKAEKVSLGNQTVDNIHGLDKPYTLEINMTGNIIDVCIAGKRCLLNRAYEQRGGELLLFVHNGVVRFEGIEVALIK